MRAAGELAREGGERDPLQKHSCMTLEIFSPGSAGWVCSLFLHWFGTRGTWGREAHPSEPLCSYRVVFSPRGSFPPRVAPGRCSWCWHAPEASLHQQQPGQKSTLNFPLKINNNNNSKAAAPCCSHHFPSLALMPGARGAVPGLSRRLRCSAGSRAPPAPGSIPRGASRSRPRPPSVKQPHVAPQTIAFVLQCSLGDVPPAPETPAPDQKPFLDNDGSPVSEGAARLSIGETTPWVPCPNNIINNFTEMG